MKTKGKLFGVKSGDREKESENERRNNICELYLV